MDNFTFVELTSANFSVCSLDDFERRQSVKKCWRKSGDGYCLLPVVYTEDWSLSERREMASNILVQLSLGSVAYGAMQDGRVVGFALVINRRFGNENQYVDLAEFYVSAPYRRKGIGKTLFAMSCAAARKFGARKLYVSAHSAEESIAAYKSYGCVLAREINQTLSEKEPCDLQLEFELK